MISILRNLPLREPSVLSALSLRRILQITDGLTARIFRLMNDLAIAAIESGTEKSLMRPSIYGNRCLTPKPRSREPRHDLA